MASQLYLVADQTEYYKPYYGNISKEIDIILKVDICPALVLFKACYNKRSCVPFIQEVNDLRLD